MIGTTVAHYKILDKLGSGGMGVVYLAEDTELSRKVALKVLPAEMVKNEQKRARFKREAKAIAALNHPNIVHVYSVEEAVGVGPGGTNEPVHFITMELVEGKTVGELLPATGFPLSQFFDIAIPLTDGVAAAHEAGITHRDLKPDNAMVSNEGRIKILDFGLAKPGRGLVGAGGGSEVPTEARTEEGAILGTVSYMSPEQAEGKTVDHRSDIFSLGVVFYEMLSGERPFGGGTSAAILSSILKETPTPLRERRPEIPRELAKIVGRCLAKEPRRRIQTSLDLHNVLQELKQDLASGELDEGLPRVRPARANKWLVAATLASLAALAGFLAQNLRSTVEDSVPRLTNPVQITSAAGVEDFPTWSPDGGRLAFQSRQSGNDDIWVAQLGGGAPVNLTADRPEHDRYPSWSPDGSRIAFGSGREAFVMSAVGGAARRVLAPEDVRGVREPQWSSDGTELAVSFWGQQKMFVELVSLRTEESRRLQLPRFACEDMSWSPDGRYLACVDAGTRGWQVGRLWLHPLSGADPISVTEDLTKNWSPSWSADGRRLFFVSNRGGSMDLWQQRIGEDGSLQGEPEPVTTGIGMRTAAFSPDGTKLAYSRGGPVGNVWRVPIRKETPATWDDAEQITFDRAWTRGLDLSPDGRTLLVSSDRAGHQSLWKLPSDGGEMTQITVGSAPDLVPDWSPDGTTIAFMSWRSGNRDLFVIPAEGGPARPLVAHPVIEHHPTWSPDGTKIAFTSTRSGNYDLWVVSVEGGRASAGDRRPRYRSVPALVTGRPMARVPILEDGAHSNVAGAGRGRVG